MAMCQGLFHLCPPHLPELPPSLTFVIPSMKRPLGGMEDLTQGSDCDRHREAAVRINWLSLCGTKNTTAFLLPICCTPTESVRSARFGIQRVMSCPDYLSLLFIYHIFLNSWQLCIKTVFLLHRHVFRQCVSNVLP